MAFTRNMRENESLKIVVGPRRDAFAFQINRATLCLNVLLQYRNAFITRKEAFVAVFGQSGEKGAGSIFWQVYSMDNVGYLFSEVVVAFSFGAWRGFGYILFFSMRNNISRARSRFTV